MSRHFARRAWTLVALAAVSTLTIAVAAPAQAADPTLTDQYTTVGSSHIGSINATLPISTTKLVATLDLNTLKIVKGTLNIAPQVVSFNALGFLPVRATVTLVQATPITGSLTVTNPGIVLKASVAYTIKISNVQAQILGFWTSLGIGPNCQTINPAVISLASPAGQYFDVSNGGNIAGTYTIGQFKGCAPLNAPDPTGLGSALINTLVPGSNNTVTVALSNGHVVNS